jgi:hypothetical protein
MEVILGRVTGPLRRGTLAACKMNRSQDCIDMDSATRAEVRMQFRPAGVLHGLWRPGANSLILFASPLAAK